MKDYQAIIEKQEILITAFRNSDWRTIDKITSELSALQQQENEPEKERKFMDDVIEELKTMSNNYQVLNGCYVISKNVLDVFIEHIESHPDKEPLPSDEDIEKWERDEAFSSNGKDLTQIQEAIVICYHTGLRVGAKAMRDGKIPKTDSNK